MKKLLSLLLVLVTIDALAQDRVPAGLISEQNALDRNTRYRMEKNHTSTKPKIAIDSINYHASGFLDLLKKVVDDPKNYNGIRIYFACDLTPDSNLTVIFVPTNRVPANPNRIHQDDTTVCYKIINKNAVNIGSKVAKEQVMAFEKKQLKDFTDNAVMRFKKDFKETTSLWYDISLFDRGTNYTTGGIGLTTYVQEMIGKNELDSIGITFGGYEFTPPFNIYYYQLTLTINFYKNDILKASFGGGSFELHRKKLMELFTKREYELDKKNIDKILNVIWNYDPVDTGVPCPPPPSGSRCGDGALLSSQ